MSANGLYYTRSQTSLLKHKSDHHYSLEASSGFPWNILSPLLSEPIIHHSPLAHCTPRHISLLTHTMHALAPDLDLYLSHCLKQSPSSFHDSILLAFRSRFTDCRRQGFPDHIIASFPPSLSLPPVHHHRMYLSCVLSVCRWNVIFIKAGTASVLFL